MGLTLEGSLVGARDVQVACPGTFVNGVFGWKMERVRLGLVSLLEGSALHLTNRIAVGPKSHPTGCRIFEQFVVTRDRLLILNREPVHSSAFVRNR